jgi:hypothetical protein
MKETTTVFVSPGVGRTGNEMIGSEDGAPSSSLRASYLPERRVFTSFHQMSRAYLTQASPVGLVPAGP